MSPRGVFGVELRIGRHNPSRYRACRLRMGLLQGRFGKRLDTFGHVGHVAND